MPNQDDHVHKIDGLINRFLSPLATKIGVKGASKMKRDQLLRTLHQVWNPDFDRALEDAIAAQEERKNRRSERAQERKVARKKEVQYTEEFLKNLDEWEKTSLREEMELSFYMHIRVGQEISSDGEYYQAVCDYFEGKAKITKITEESISAEIVSVTGTGHIAVPPNVGELLHFRRPIDTNMMACYSGTNCYLKIPVERKFWYGK